jgi:protein-S-isoprenylcysteine O-methyltransferase Ste14
MDTQKQGRLATMGVYGRVRHPQYMGFIVIMFGVLLQWPTILTLLMFLALITMYVHLTHTEEAEARVKFGEAYERYASRVPGWFPILQRFRSSSRTAG